MRVFDVPKAWVTGAAALRVGVHGSCRVHDPFEALAADGLLIKVWANNYAVSYSLSEARQMLNFSTGERDIPHHLLPFIFDDPTNALTSQNCAQSILGSVDVFIIEVSEIRHVRYREFFFQIQVFIRNFVSKYGAAVLPWYRVFSSGESVSEEIVQTALTKLPPSISQQDKSIVESILREARLEEISNEAIRRIIEELKEGCIAQWIFVSHFQVPGLLGSLMADRGKLRALLKEATEDCAVQFFDPTDLVIQYGRERMLANGGADIYHYNPTHQSVVARTLLKTIGSAKVEGRHFEEESLPQSRRERHSLQFIASALNALLVPFHRERVKRLGIDGSGLHAHYSNLLDRGLIITARDIEVADIVLRFLPQFDLYHVFRAGLGEIAFLLSGFGNATAAYDPFSARFMAMAEGGGYLQDCRVLGSNCSTNHDIVPLMENDSRTLAIATQLLITVPPEQEDDVLNRLQTYDAILCDPSMLIRQRALAEQEELMMRFRDAGYLYTRYFPQQRLMYFSRHER